MTEGTREISRLAQRADSGVDDGLQVGRRRRHRTWLIGGIGVLVVVIVATAVMSNLNVGKGSAPAPSPPVTTAAVERTDLAEQRSAAGQLGYGTEHVLVGRKGGTVTSLPTANAVVQRGEAMYGVDAVPVPLFYGEIPLYREVGQGIKAGPDVRVVETNLAALGFGGFGTPDNRFTDATATAITRWQKKNGLPMTGVIRVGDVVIAPDAVRISSLTSELGADASGQILSYTGTTRQVSITLTPTEKALAPPGATVRMADAERRQATGTIAGAMVVPGGDNGPKLAVAISMDDPAAFDGLDAGLVDVRLTAGERTGVLAVPVGALLALSEGGYGVEVVDGAARRLVAVQVGLFADGKVEVTGDELREGMTVVTTS